MSAVAYPNPFNQELSIKTTNMWGIVTATLSDLSGRLIATKTVNASEGQLSFDNLLHLNSGLYAVKISTNETNTTTIVVKN